MTGLNFFETVGDPYGSPEPLCPGWGPLSVLQAVMLTTGTSKGSKQTYEAL
jgi:hypothetical protein